MLAGGQPPARDPVGVCWHAFASYLVGDATGYVGVRVVPAGAFVKLQSGGGARVVRRAPWMPEVACTLDDVVEQASEDIAEALKAALEFPAKRAVVGLTGGKDSRLLLAVALANGLAHEFEYETVGPPKLADVQVASEIAELFGLRHEVKFLGLASRDPYEQQIRRFCSATAGMVSIWDLSPVGAISEELRVVGLCGEPLRTMRPLRSPIVSTEALLGLFPAKSFNRVGLVRPEVATQLHQELLGCVLDDPSGHADPLDEMDAFYIRNRLRYLRVGPRDEVNGLHRLSPLYSIRGIRGAFGLGGLHRQSEVLHFEIVRRGVAGASESPARGAGLETSAPREARASSERTEPGGVATGVGPRHVEACSARGPYARCGL